MAYVYCQFIFYTRVCSVKIKWYYDDKLMSGNLTDISSNVDINLFCYEQQVRTNGMKAYISVIIHWII